MVVLKKLWELLKGTFEEWKEDKVSRLAAALSYYTIFSLPGLLLIIVAVAGFFLGQESVREDLMSQVGSVVGDDGAEAIGTMLSNAGWDRDAGVVAVVVGIVTVIVAATGAFTQLQEALNTVWEVAPAPGAGILQTLQKRFLSFSLILGIAFLLLVSLVVSTALAGLGNFLEDMFPGAAWLIQILNVVISFAVITLLFALMYKYLPDAEIALKDVFIGAALTTLLFTVGKFALGFYLGRSSATSAYGAAGSLVLILLWIYYSAQIFLFGAEFTQVYARKHGSRVVPDEDAVRVTEAQRIQEGRPSEETVREAARSGQGAAALQAPPSRVEEGFLVQKTPLALPPPPRSGLLPTLRRVLPAAALFAGGLLLGFVLGPTDAEE
ncbi:MAG: YihY/virulence factor BrkB family protein [Chloroflexi bacterium]|nr:MAG: YihY/virulence factor BrkB family protein [Chloroflexota bacterium]